MQNKVHVILPAQSLLLSGVPASHPPCFLVLRWWQKMPAPGSSVTVASSELGWLVTARGISHRVR